MHFRTILVLTGLYALLLAHTALSQNSDSKAIERAAAQALNFDQGDLQSLQKSKSSFTPAGWNEFMKTMQGFLDARGAPTFTSKFVVVQGTTEDRSKGDPVSLKIPGTLTQSSGGSSTTYRLHLEVRAVGNPAKIEHLEQVTCPASRTENYCM